MKRMFATLALLACGMAYGQQHPLFKDADLKLGEKLIEENKCTACHIRNVGGDGSDIYNPKGRINTAGLLRGMVDYCSTQLNLGFFPEDTTAVAAVLNKQHYKFK
jgi:hypothetical protein